MVSIVFYNINIFLVRCFFCIVRICTCVVCCFGVYTFCFWLFSVLHRQISVSLLSLVRYPICLFQIMFHNDTILQVIFYIPLRYTIGVRLSLVDFCPFSTLSMSRVISSIPNRVVCRLFNRLNRSGLNQTSKTLFLFGRNVYVHPFVW